MYTFCIFFFFGGGYLDMFNDFDCIFSVFFWNFSFSVISCVSFS